MLRVGDFAPDFTARTTEGSVVTLSELRGGFVVLYFFPKAFAPGCRNQTLRFRDARADIHELGGTVLGVSVDEHHTQVSFAQATRSQFPLIGDEDGEISRLYGVLRPFLKLDKRVTYVIDPEGRIAGVFEHEFQVSRHLDGVLHLLESLKLQASPEATQAAGKAS
jgi:peroxiredoxin